ncbi:MAG TPA: SH3 domain-containing protein [Caldilineaceae bacterium]|nr:SH3 domain-containing protein [Caldilineaceae bacterium]
MLNRWLRHYWPAVVAALFLAVLLAGTPSWAAPVARPQNQTVPRPTPTDSGEPVATATPRPDRGDEDDESTPSQPGAPGAAPGQPGAAPNPALLALTPQPAGPVLTAVVDVATLNLRDGPGTEFAILGSLVAGAQVTVLARNEDASWWYVCCLPDATTQGWVSAQLLTPSFDRNLAGTLIPLFGDTPAPAVEGEAAAPAVGEAGAAAAPEVTPQAMAEQPLAIDFALDPPFVWQGITGTLEIRLSNPNAVDITGVELSDELPAALTLLDASADGGGAFEQINTPAGTPLLIFRWPVIPAGVSVSAQITIQVDSDLPNGELIDNLVSVTAANAAYTTGAITIGMPPVELPVFE